MGYAEGVRVVGVGGGFRGSPLRRHCARGGVRVRVRVLFYLRSGGGSALLLGMVGRPQPDDLVEYD
ncbi:hypothetical protein ACIG87_07275 [Micromonospora sp. NPDC051925]|uniref:hypothetical protein n=1 Tax=Micromonospora sp. NPDC051925 TaxID=3364288 RepID=UPI0037C805E4